MKTTTLLSRFIILCILLTLQVQAGTTLRLSKSRFSPECKSEIIFEKAVVSNELIGKKVPNNLIKIEPELPGKLFWKSANIAEFILTTAPIIGETYLFSIPENQTFLNGSKLPSGLIRKVNCEHFKVQTYLRKSKSKEYTRNLQYYICFNDTVDPLQGSRFIYYQSKEGQRISVVARRATWGDVKQSYYRGQTWNDRFIEAITGKKITYSEKTDSPIPNGLIVTPVIPLPVGNQWRLYVSKEMPNQSQNTTLALNGGNHIWIGDISPFQVRTINAYVRANQPRRIYVSFNTAINEKLSKKELDNFITIYPKPDNLGYKINHNSITISGDFRKQDKWRFKIHPAMKSKNGLALNKAVSEELKFQSVPTGLALPDFDAAQYAYGNRHYGIETVNLSTARIRIKHIAPDKAIRTMQAYRHYTGRGKNGKTIKQQYPIPYTLVEGKTIYDKVLKLDNAIDTSKSIPLNWNEILPKNTDTGAFFISVEGEAKDKARGGDRIAQAFLQLTDIGLCWKINKEEALIYAFSCKTGKPLPNLQLQMFNDDVTAADNAVTNELGIARIPRSKKTHHLRAKLGKDLYIIPFDDTLPTESLWRFPVQTSWYHIPGWKREAAMFTDRNLYRPKETVHLKGIIREHLDTQIRRTKDTEAQLTIKDSARRILYDQKIKLSENGTFDHTLTLPAETVGRFNVKLTFPENPDHATLGSWQSRQFREFRHSFHVQEFRRNAFELKSNLAKTEPGVQQINLSLKANYYQGQAVQNAKMNWHLTTTETGFYPKKYRDFLFGNHQSYDPYYWSSYFGYDSGYHSRKQDFKHGELKLDEDGKAQISLDLPKPKAPSPLLVKTRSQVTDARNQTLTSITKQTVHPADIYIGITRNDKLIRTGEKTNFQLIAINAQEKMLEKPVSVNVIIKREFYDTVKVQSHDGTMVKTNNTKRTETFSEKTITIQPKQENLLDFTPKKTGRYLITLKGKDAQDRDFATTCYYHVYGSNEYPWATEDGMKIKLVPEKQKYQPNETARILVMTPIEGRALVTVERAGVMEEFHYDLKADNPVIEVPLNDRMAPNAFISVIIMRGADASPRKNKEPALKLGYCTLNVENKKDRLKVDLEVVGSQHRPSEPTTIQGTITMPDGSPASSAEVILYAEDEGTLAVMGYKNPDFMKTFHAPRPLLVRSGTSFSTFLSEDVDSLYYGNKGFTIGGGDADPFGGSAGIALKNRTNFDPCAFWKPSIITDEKGKFSVTFKNPDTMTRYRVIAVALKGDQKFGSKISDYTVDKPIMLEPSTPRYASEGDQLQVKTLVQNKSEFSGVWKVSLQTNDLTKPLTATPLEKTIKLEAGKSGTVNFDVRFVETGTAKWTWTAQPLSLQNEKLTIEKAKDLSDRMESIFEVTYPVPLMRQKRLVTMKADSGQINLLQDLDPELLGGKGTLEVNLSSSMLLEAKGAITYLLRYPYGCVEQTSSSLMPWFAVRDLKSIIPAFQEKDESEIAKAIQKGADRLLTMQTRDGGLAYWPGGKNPEVWCSAYGGLALLLAREHGATVPESAINKLTDWITKSLKDGPTRASDHRWSKNWDMETRARALYVIALAGKAQVSMQNKMMDVAEKLTPTARCFLALAIHKSGNNNEHAKQLLNNMPARHPEKHWMPYHIDDAMLVLALSEIDPTNKKVYEHMRKLLNDRNPRGHWRTTWCNAWSLQAMASYARNVEKKLPASSVQLLINGETKTISLDTKNPTKSLTIPLKGKVSLLGTTNGNCFTELSLAAKPQIAPAGPRASNGLSIIRRYERMLPDGTIEPMKQPQLGDLIRVSLDITIPYALNYIVIEDRLPSIFEAVNNQFKSQSSNFRGNTDHSWRVSHKELRSDRAVFFFNRSWSGAHTLTYVARVTSSGTATAPSAKVEAMYNPEQRALSDTVILTTSKK